ncbi:hypothetical protein ACJMK2_036419 [Sinanodonta woodiana]|uniref:Ras-related protein Rab-15 n=1 Tax=Sinanodonta woodiana TaxID=1069815 RepID=A0ABD3WKQ8_SINWO
MTSKRYDSLVRLLLVGETGVGKTCLLCRFSNDEFMDSHISTIGIDFKMKTLCLDGQTVKVQIWDTAGQERFEAITKQFYRRAQGIMLVYDICNRRSFEALPKWLSYIHECCKNSVMLVLIGNKSDQQDKRQVPYLEAQKFADENNIEFFEASAKMKNNLEKPFLDICRNILKNSQPKEEHEKENTSITIEKTVEPNTAGNSSEGLNKELVPQQGSGWGCCVIS